ncbi:MAG: tRNA pseudouridine(38-40) synthase TruA [Nitriliruptoraceae bacterium]
MRLRIDLAYDGGPFAGFARQQDQITVQGALEGAWSRLYGTDVPMTCAGRTDRGVHALAQVVHVDLPGDTHVQPETRLRLDALVGDAITIWEVRPVPAEFHARFSATSRAYRYRLVDDPAAVDPIVRHDRWRVNETLDIAAMRAAARALMGEHDFASFCRANGRHTTRRIDVLTVTRVAPGRVDVRFKAPAFCHQQVRAIVGCLVDVGRHRRPACWVGEVLAAQDRAVAARVAPAHGLTLEHVSYGRRWPAAPPRQVRRALQR